MYEEFFQLPANPFQLTPDPRFVVITPSYREAFAGLIYALHWRKGFVALSAQPGTGKSMLLSLVLRALSTEQALSSYIVNPTLTASEFLETVLLDLGIANIPSSKAQRLQILRELLVRANVEGKTAVLIVDEAHKLSPELLEEIRLLTNFETADAKLLQVVLAGQPELDELLNRDDLSQLRQRISLRLQLTALSEADTRFYIRHRWIQSGAPEPPPFPEDVISAIAHISHGIPRVINVLCDNCLTLAFSLGLRFITPEHLAEVASGLQMNLLGIAAKKPTDSLIQPVPPVSVPEPQNRPQVDWIRTLDRQDPLPQSSLLIRIALRLGCKVKHPFPKSGQPI